MIICKEIGCMNSRYDNMLERDVCDERYPRPDECPLTREERKKYDKRKSKHSSV